MVDIDIKIDEKTLDDLNVKLNQYAEVLGKHSETASRRAAIMICKIFRKNTKPSKKYKSINITKDNSEPKKKYISYSHGQKLSTPLRRYKVDLVDRSKSVIRYVDPNKFKQDIRRSTGTNYKPEEKKGGVRGLAKLSWGWVMHKLFASNPDLPFKRRSKDKRYPKDAVRESKSEFYKASSKSISYARISNKLDYIVDALKGYTPQNAIDTAIRWMTREIDRLTSKM